MRRLALSSEAAAMGRLISRLHGPDGREEDLLTAWASLLYAHLQEGRVYLNLNDPTAGLEMPDITLPPLEAGPAWLEHVAPDQPASGEKPLVISGRTLWFARYHDYNFRLREKLDERNRRPPISINEPRLAEDLPKLFPAAGRARDTGQGLAAAHLIDLHFGLLTGGPGTGKTTSLAKMLLLRLRQTVPDHRAPVYLLAPTGKAAARLKYSLVASTSASGDRTAMDRLMEDLSDDPEFRELLLLLDPNRENSLVRTMTIHKALGVRRDRRAVQGPFWRDDKNPLNASMVIVDEVSMVDLALMTRLVDAIPPDTPLILVGDAEQLKSVEAGPVLADLASEHTPLAGDRAARLHQRLGGPCAITAASAYHVRLTHNFRFGADSTIGRLAAAANRGDGDDFLTLLASGSPDVTWIRLPQSGRHQPRPVRDVMLENYAYGELAMLLSTPPPSSLASGPDLVRAMDRCRVLCAIHAGPDGAERWNDRLQRWIGGGREYDRARAVMISVNDPSSGLCNGDTGMIVPAPDGARFFSSDGTTCPAALLPAHQPGWAITIHKSQGSEYDTVFVVLPREGGRRLLTRRLLYTSITRARKKVILVATEQAIRSALTA